MAVDLELTPKTKRAAGEPLLRAGRLPRRRARAGRCAWPRSPRRSATRSACSSSTCCASTPARSASASSSRCSTSPSPPLSHHLKKLREAGHRRLRAPGLWAYYYVIPDALAGAVRMAELSTEPTSAAATDAQATCCEPSDKAACCGTSAAGGSCGCAAGEPHDIRESVRERYAAAARRAAEQPRAAPSTLAEADDGRAVRRHPLRRRRDRRRTDARGQRVARLRRADRGRRPARRRDRARPRLRRRRRRPDLRPPRRRRPARRSAST